MQTEKEEEDDASAEEFVALCDFSGSGTEQVGNKTAGTLRNKTKNFNLCYFLLSHSLISGQGTSCLFSPSPQQTGGGQSCWGSKVMFLPATCSRTQLRGRTTLQRTLGRMKNTLAAMGHWLDT